jgi:peptidoglycan/xylan/chitin deacetylase (PgdA/CDA1 family)
MVMTGATHHRLILFTFDDGPDHRYTRRLLDTLDRERIRAVFFLAARRFEGTYPRDRELASIAQEIVLRGHFVGNHTMDHLQLPLVTNVDLDAQITAADAVFERVLGERTWLMRPPGGGRSARVDAWLAERGYTQMLWNLGTGDFQVRTSDAVLATFRAVLDREENERGVRGGIVLLHDIHAWSVDAFPRIVGMLEDRNCDLLDAGEELYDFADDPALFFAPRGEAGASAEAPFVELAPEVLEARQRRARARAEAHCSEIASR